MSTKRNWIFFWAAVRLPLLGLIAYAFRYPLVTWFENSVGFLGRMDFFVFTISTLSTRLILFLFATSGLVLIFFLISKINIHLWLQYALSLIASFIGIHLSFTLLFLVPDALLRTNAIILYLAVNTLPYEWLSMLLDKKAWTSPIYIVGVGFAEGLLPQSYALWLMNIGKVKTSVIKWVWLGGVLISSFLWIFLLIPYDSPRVFTLTERLHADPDVEKFETGIYNWVELNPENGSLYAVGRGTNFLLTFDIGNLSHPPKRSREDIGKTQSFGFNPQRQELYVYKSATRELLYMDALTANVTRSIPVPDLSPGDVWVRWVPLSDTIVLSSEADAEIGIPLYVFNRESGEIIASMDFPVIPTAYLIIHPEKEIMYFNSFKDPYFAVWDMKSYEIIKQVQITPRTDRMIFLNEENEVWVASPLDGSILRYDASTLENTGRIKSSFGDRTLNVDPQRNLLLTGNFLNGRLTIIDLNTGRKLTSYYLAPWIRTIALDIENGNAYVSTVRGLFKVNYAH